MKIAILNIIIHCILLIISQCAYAQPGIPWHREFGGPEDERANDISFYNDGYVVVGFGASTDIPGDSADSIDLLIMILNDVGLLQEYRYFGGSSSEEALACTIHENTLYAVGHSNSSDGDLSTHFGNGDMFILSYNLQIGSMNWIKSIGGSDSEELRDVVYSNGNIYAAGYSRSMDNDITNAKGQDDAILVSFNAETGSQNYLNNYGGTNDDAFSKLMLSPAGHLYALGHSRSSDGDLTENNGSLDVWLVKIDTLGNIMNEESYGGTSADVGKSMVIEDEDRITVLAESLSSNGDVIGPNNGNEDFWLFRTDNGSLSLSVLLGGDTGDYPKDIAATSDGHYVLTGGSTSFVTGSLPGGFALVDQWLLKVDMNGNIVWQRAVGGTDIDFGHAILADSDKDFTVAGYSDSPDGDFGGRLMHESHDTWVVHFSEDYASGLEEIEFEESRLDVQIFPNPSSSLCTVQSNSPILKVELYTSKGSLCQTNYSAYLDISSLAPGLYYLSITLAEGKTVIRKLIRS